MKRLYSIKKRATIFFAFVTIAALLIFIGCYNILPKDILIYEGENLLVKSALPYSISTPASFGGVLDESGNVTSDSYSTDKQYIKAEDAGSYSASVRLFGVIPIKDISINVSETKELIPGGNAIGIKMFTNGLLCVGISEVADISGAIINPSSENDIKTGDIFLSANGKKLTATEQFSELVTESGGKEINLIIERNSKQITRKITPVKTSDGYKLGIWVRDSTAGIGTLSFIDRQTGLYGALGHPILDSDTGTLLPVSSGSVAKAEIFNIEKGEKGAPGELKGTFSAEEKDFGTVESNTQAGIYGRLITTPSADSTLLPVGSRNSVKKGKAQIISCLSDKDTDYYDIEIQKILTFGSDGNKNMVIKITDDELLNETGGIVQGMSGSPIIQNGKLVGAVTHVFVNDPTRGYGIFIENMLAEAEKINHPN